MATMKKNILIVFVFVLTFLSIQNFFQGSNSPAQVEVFTKDDDFIYRMLMVGDVMLARNLDAIFPVHVADKDVRMRAMERLEKGGRKVVLEQRGHAYIWGDVLPLFSKDFADVRIINLETSITNTSQVYPKKKYTFRMASANVKSLLLANVDYCSLGNNHVMDFQVEGMKDTFRVLDDIGIAWTGAGNDLDRAVSPVIIEKGGLKIGFFSACSQNVFWSAQPDKPGIHFINIKKHDQKDIERLCAAVKSARKKHKLDLVGFSLHWGDNYDWNVPDAFRRFAHSLIDDCSIDVIHGHSSHHIKGIEIYHNRPIIYGCGDFVDDYGPIDKTYRSDLSFVYLVDFDRRTKDFVQMELIPTKIEFFSVTRALTHSDRKWLEDKITKLSEPFGTTIETTSRSIFIRDKS